MFKRRFAVTVLSAVFIAGAGLLAAAHLTNTGANAEPQRTVAQPKQKVIQAKPLGDLQPLAKPLGAPIAYGFVQYDGSLSAGSGNITSEWNSTSHRYYIHIAGVSYSPGTHITFVTPQGNGGVFMAATWDDNGTLVVCTGQNGGSSGAQVPFQFIVYKIS